MIEKILERLEEAFPVNPYPNEFSNGRDFGIKKAIEIVQEVAKEYDWIPVEERLPDYKGYNAVYWVTLKNKFGLSCTRKMRWHENGKWIWLNGQDLGSEWEAIAWKSYEVPTPYQKGE